MEKNLSSNLKQIHGLEIISLVRTAFAFQDVVLLKFKIPCEGNISAFEDNNIRASDAVRSMQISFFENYLSVHTQYEKEIEIEIVCGQVKLVLACEILQLSEKQVQLALPKSGFVKQLRISNRFKLKSQIWNDGLIIQKENTVPCSYKVTDYSSDGIGISVLTNKSLESYAESSIQGDSFTNAYHFKGPYKVKRLELLNRTEKFYEYAVGLENYSNLTVLEKSTRASRHSASTTITLNIPATSTKVLANITDISASGFKAIVNRASLRGIVTGLISYEANSNLNFKIIRISNESEVAFELVSNNPSDRIKWLNLIVPVLTCGRTDVVVGDPRNLLSLFFEAGGSVVEGLDYKRLKMTEAETLAVLTAHSEVLIRWVNISDTGNLLAHHSTYRVGLNTWYTGDVVGGQLQDNKADKSFFKNNFRMLKEVMETFPTQQKIIGFWPPAHPYWQTWRNFILKESKSYSTLLCDSVSRSQLEKLQCTSKKILELSSYKSLCGRDLFEEFAKISVELQWFLGSLDVFSTGDVGNATAEIYNKNGHYNFKRSISKLTLGKNSFLVFFSQMPPGISINRTFDSAFLIPLNNQSLTVNERDEIYSLTLALASKHGFGISSLRFFSEKTPHLGNSMEFFVIDSTGLEVF